LEVKVKNTKDFNLQDYLHEFPENVKTFFAGIDGPSFGGGAAVGSAVGAVATVVIRNLSEQGTFDPISDFVEYVRAYKGDAEVIDVDAEIIDVITIDEDEAQEVS
jgi:hypothetical protein